MISAATRLCVTCLIPLPEPPSPPVCGQCSRVHVPHHSEWPPVLKWWLIRDFALTRFLPWLSEQAVFESLLRDAFNGIRSGVTPNPNGAQFTMSTPAEDFYALALQRAQDWKINGSPIGPELPRRI